MYLKYFWFLFQMLDSQNHLSRR